MAGERRQYHQFCALARALDVLGERWTLLIVRNLLLGPRRYSALLEELPGITTNLLAKRLQEMTAAGIVERVEAAPPAGVAVYRLTARGEALESAIMALGRWGDALLDRPSAGDRIDIGWGILALKRRYRGGRSLVAELRIDGRRFELGLGDERLAVRERAAVRPDVTVSGPLASFQAWLFRDQDPESLRAQGALTVEAPPAAWRTLRTAFAKRGHAPPH